MVVLEALAMGSCDRQSRGWCDRCHSARKQWLLVEPQNSVDLAEAITTLGMQPKLWQQLRQAESIRIVNIIQIKSWRSA